MTSYCIATYTGLGVYCNRCGNRVYCLFFLPPLLEEDGKKVYRAAMCEKCFMLLEGGL